MADCLPVHVHDMLSDEGAEFVIGREMSRVDGCHTLLGRPLLREGEAIGAILLRRAEVHPFSDKQIALLQTFADQAVIALGNVRLFDEVQARTRDLTKSLDELRTAQDRLIQTEKLASLGQLTAGIAHEIKNPLNFINNFSALSVDLLAELGEALAPAALDKARRRRSTSSPRCSRAILKGGEHGKRADSIVKNMLFGSRAQDRASPAGLRSMQSSTKALISLTMERAPRSRASMSRLSASSTPKPGWPKSFRRKSHASFST